MFRETGGSRKGVFFGFFGWGTASAWLFWVQKCFFGRGDRAGACCWSKSGLFGSQGGGVPGFFGRNVVFGVWELVSLVFLVCKCLFLVGERRPPGFCG